MENSFLFDMRSGVILASDNRHRNDNTLNQLTEYVSRFTQFRELYKGLKTGDDANGDDTKASSETGQETSWWDEEDPEEPWAFQATRLLPKTTLALWQLTPYVQLDRVGAQS
jgi:Ras-related GTP-binding protein C/D